MPVGRTDLLRRLRAEWPALGTLSCGRHEHEGGDPQVGNSVRSLGPHGRERGKAEPVSPPAVCLRERLASMPSRDCGTVVGLVDEADESP